MYPEQVKKADSRLTSTPHSSSTKRKSKKALSKAKAIAPATSTSDAAFSAPVAQTDAERTTAEFVYPEQVKKADSRLTSTLRSSSTKKKSKKALPRSLKRTAAEAVAPAVLAQSAVRTAPSGPAAPKTKAVKRKSEDPQRAKLQPNKRIRTTSTQQDQHDNCATAIHPEQQDQPGTIFAPAVQVAASIGPAQPVSARHVANTWQNLQCLPIHGGFQSGSSREEAIDLTGPSREGTPVPDETEMAQTASAFELRFPGVLEYPIAPCKRISPRARAVATMTSHMTSSVQDGEQPEVASLRQPVAPREGVRPTVQQSHVEKCLSCQNSAADMGQLCRVCFHSPTRFLEAVSKKFGLSIEQTAVLEAVATGENIFCSAGAETDKKGLIQAIVHYLKAFPLGVSVLASTSVHATSIGGRSMSSFLNWTHTTRKDALGALCERARSQERRHLRRVDVLVIDGINTIENNNLTRLSQMLQAAASMRSISLGRQPFGGAQVIVLGDFYQMTTLSPAQHCLWCGQPTTKRPDGTRVCETHGEFPLKSKFAFNSPAWNASDFKAFELMQMRGPMSAAFASLLQSSRVGANFTADERDMLLHHQRMAANGQVRILASDPAAATKINAQHANQLRTAKLTVKAWDHFEWNEELHPELGGLGANTKGGVAGLLQALDNHGYLMSLILKIDMQVVLLTDVDPANEMQLGAVGKVVDFVDMEDENMPRMRMSDADQPVLPGQLLSGAVGHYQAARIQEFRENLPEASRKWPVVQFQNGIRRVIFADCQVTQLGRQEPRSLLSRTMIPLQWGWAISISHAQCMMFDNVIINLAEGWKPGQAYMALSRAKTLGGLTVDELPESNEVDPAVQRFMEETFGDHGGAV